MFCVSRLTRFVVVLTNVYVCLHLSILCILRTSIKFEDFQLQNGSRWSAQEGGEEGVEDEGPCRRTAVSAKGLREEDSWRVSPSNSDTFSHRMLVTWSPGRTLDTSLMISSFVFGFFNALIILSTVVSIGFILMFCICWLIKIIIPWRKITFFI